MSTSEVGTMYGPLRILCNKGVRYATVIDVGCADGHFFLNAFAAGLLPGALPLNIDANPIYEPSLQEIKKVVGGDFRISAVSDHGGKVDLTMSKHPYWSSLRPKNDPYWLRINNLSATKASVPATTLDNLSRELDLRPPFLLKLDVQGAEQNVLRGSVGLLEKTHVVICEADVDDFQEINSILVQNDFVLYDATHLQRIADGTLGWFYPVYINRSLDFVRPKSFWDTKDNDAIIRVQVERRKAILASNANLLLRIKGLQGTLPSSSN
jgi:FkbM family methyltransferase